MRGLLLVGALASTFAWLVYSQNKRYHLVEQYRQSRWSATAGAYATGKPLVLFLGNSLTNVNDLPSAFAQISRSLGENVGVGMQAPGGQTLEGHLKDPAVAQALAAKEWDYVVLQEQSQRAAFGDEQVENETIKPALKLVAMIRAARPSAKVAFFETWGRPGGDRDNCKEIPELCTYEGQQARLNRANKMMAERAQGLLVPVAEAWTKVKNEHPEIRLWQDDHVHPAVSGTYLTACVFYSSIFHKSPVGADKLWLDEKDARVLQEAAKP